MIKKVLFFLVVLLSLSCFLVVGGDETLGRTYTTWCELEDGTIEYGTVYRH